MIVMPNNVPRHTSPYLAVYLARNMPKYLAARQSLWLARWRPPSATKIGHIPRQRQNTPQSVKQTLNTPTNKQNH